THNYLGIVYSQNNKFELAERHLQKAIQLEPRYAEAHFNLAVIYATQKPPFLELARKHYSSAISLGSPPDPIMERLLKNPQSSAQSP
ncbi:MAG: tetratricopeptide repeat protein, partial [Chthoniobacterales bacterium]|nr:tetratricopeptide repeat protein [Chthoniobacterales bacterium]